MKTKELDQVKEFIQEEITKEGYWKKTHSIERMQYRHSDDKFMDTKEYGEHMRDILVGRGMEEAGWKLLKHIEKLEKEGVPEPPKLTLEEQLHEIKIKENEILQKILAKQRGAELANKSKQSRELYKLKED